MREPQVVRRARVHRMSLCAIGMPVSGPAAARARISSARLAALSARGSSSVMKLFSVRSKRPMRSKQARVSSVDEILFAARAAESSESVAFSTLFDHLGHEVQPVFDRRRDGLIKRALVGLAHFVGAQPLRDIERV